MPREFRLPDVGEGISEGELVRWLVEPGDPVEEDQPVAEVETDKALVEIPSPVTGSVSELRAEEGEIVPVGDVIIVFTVDGEADEPIEDSRGPKGEAADEATDAVESSGEAADSADGDTAGDDAGGTGRVFAAPHVRRLARELGIDLSRVDGSGPSGRVTEADVRRMASGGASAPAADPAEEPEGTPEPNAVEPASGDGQTRSGSAATETTAGSERDRTLAAPATRRVARELDVNIDAVPPAEEREGEAFVDEAAVREHAAAQRAGHPADGTPASTGTTGDTTGREERIPYRGVRRTIGERMTESAYTAPHVSHHDSVDVTRLVQAREGLKPRAEERGIRLTYVPFVLKAVVAALREFPYMNAELDEEAEEIVLKHEYDIGIAVATDHGLMVPVVEGVDRKGLLEIASEVNDLAAKARDRTIAPEELQGSTFTITNFGAIGGEYATPIINYPEVGILGLGAIEERPTAVDGAVEARPTLPLSLSIDHRVVDGATGARFTNTIKEYLKEPTLLLLE